MQSLWTRTFHTGDPICIPHAEDGEERWTLVSPIGFRDTVGLDWWTRPFFETDGASIPAPLRVLFGHPFRSDYIRAAALHDFYYYTRARQYGLTDLGKKARKEIDLMFYEALIADGVPPWKARILYAGVRSGGWIAWRNHAQEAKVG